MMIKSMLTSAVSILLLTSGAAWAQSTGASPADPNNERNQRPAMSNTQPADPATDDTGARVPTDPDDAAAADREEGGATGEAPGDTGTYSGEEAPSATAPEATAPPQAEP